MVSLIHEFKSESQDRRYDGEVAVRRVLDKVHINMPWSHLDRYMHLVLEKGINIEIGFGAEELESTPLKDIIARVAMLRDRGCRITVHGPFWDLCPGSVDPAIRDVSRSRLSMLFDVLEHIRPVQVVCHTGFDPRHHRGHRKNWIDKSALFWEKFVARAEKIGSPLVLENVWEEDPELHLQLFEHIDSEWFGFCLDTGHQNAFSKTSLDKWLNATAGHLREIHLHDNDGSFDHHLPVGDGNIDFDFLFGFLKAKGLRPILTLEPHKEDHLYSSLNSLSKMESFLEIL